MMILAKSTVFVAIWRRSKLIKIVDRSVLRWDTVVEYDADPITSDSDDGKKIREAENSALTKRKTKASNKLTLYVPSQKPSGHQFRIDGEHNGFIPLSQRNFDLRFPPNSFTQDGYYQRTQVAQMSDQGTRALVAVKEDTVVNTARTPDTIGNEFSDLSNDDTIQEFEFEKGNNYPSLKRRLKKNLIFWWETLSANSPILEIIDNGYKIWIFDFEFLNLNLV